MFHDQVKWQLLAAVAISDGHNVMSSSVTALSLFKGVAEVVAGANQAVSGQRQGTPWTSHQLIAGPSLMATAHQEQSGVQYLAQ